MAYTGTLMYSQSIIFTFTAVHTEYGYDTAGWVLLLPSTSIDHQED